mmetsp:Transcript_83605/g.163741  ORF Transcript_83605/g.163741 Transcript_83605/m.163741 type:complete len:268 (-) Transcript_83605:28-831(-)
MPQLPSQAVPWSEEGICRRSWTETVLLALLLGQLVSLQDIRPQVAATVKVLQAEVMGATMEFQAQPTAQHRPNILLHRQLIARPLLRIRQHRLSTLQHRLLTAQLLLPTVQRHRPTALLHLHTVQRLRHTVQRHRRTVRLHRSIPPRRQLTARHRPRIARHHQTTRQLRLLTVLPLQRIVPHHRNIHRHHRRTVRRRRRTVQRLPNIVQQALHTAPRVPPIHQLVRPTAPVQAKTETKINRVVELRKAPSMRRSSEISVHSQLFAFF